MEIETGLTRGDPQELCEDGCGRAAVTGGRCKSHHWSWYRKQETDDFDRQCLVGWCKRIHVSYGRCHSHYGNMKRRMKARGEWPPTKQQMAQQDSADIAARRPCVTVTPVAPRTPDQRSACPDCPAVLLIHPGPSEAPDGGTVATISHNSHCPRVRYVVSEDIRTSDIPLPPGVDYLRHAIDLGHVTS